MGRYRLVTDKVLALAKEACKVSGIYVTTADNKLIMRNRDIIEFAALIQQQMEAENAEQIKKAVKDEREACAKIAEKYEPDEKTSYVHYASQTIRARNAK